VRRPLSKFATQNLEKRGKRDGKEKFGKIEKRTKGAKSLPALEERGLCLLLLRISLGVRNGGEKDSQPLVKGDRALESKARKTFFLL